MTLPKDWIDRKYRPRSEDALFFRFQSIAAIEKKNIHDPQTDLYRKVFFRYASRQYVKFEATSGLKIGDRTTGPKFSFRKFINS